MSRQFRSDDTNKWVYGFGRGLDGALTSSGNLSLDPTRQSCSGSSGSTSLSVSTGSGTLANNQLVIIHQSRGTGAGAWELNRIQSGGGTATLTMAHTLQNTYTDSGASQAQIVRVYEYTNYNLQSGHTYTLPAWDGNDGGIYAIAVADTCTIAGTLDGSGADGTASPSNTPGATGGFRGGAGSLTAAQKGEGTTGGVTTGTTNNGNGGGGGSSAGSPAWGGGGGGSNGTAGNAGSGGTGGAAGSTAGAAALTTMVFGGGGGGGARNSASAGEYGAGGSGGGILFIIANQLTISGAINLDGGGASATFWNGGGGAGGSCLLKANTATLGSSLITADGGDATGSSNGDGGSGRIHLDYSKSYSGTTSPTIDVTQDVTIKNLTNSALVF